MLLTRESILKILRENKGSLTEKYGLTKLGLFGSFARGTATEESDVDLCFDTEKVQPFVATHIKEEFESLLHCSVDIVQPHPFMRALLLERLEKEVIYV